VVERRQELWFSLESRHALYVTGKDCRQDFNGDIAIQATVACAMHLTHAARTERRLNFIWPKFLCQR
jgi:hypothetical protein